VGYVRAVPKGFFARLLAPVYFGSALNTLNAELLAVAEELAPVPGALNWIAVELSAINEWPNARFRSRSLVWTASHWRRCRTAAILLGSEESRGATDWIPGAVRSAINLRRSKRTRREEISNGSVPMKADQPLPATGS
jgi:hypothetical protein